jgi:beta-lactamase regulating signal transducer with metallopeptidase domain
MSTPAIAGWLLTYLVHSTIFLAAALLVARILGEHRLALQEMILRAALLAGLATTSLPMMIDFQPTVALTMGGRAASSSPAEAAHTSSALEPTPSSQSLAPAIAVQVPPWHVPLLGLWGVISGFWLVRLARSRRQLQLLLASRRPRPVGRLLARLATMMGIARRFRFSTSEEVGMPIVTGIARPEICCPETIDELDPEHQAGIFAHELAHLARSDPRWRLLYRVFEAVFWMQPLNRWAVTRLEDLAEHLADERAVACTGDRLGLARCLVALAHWPAVRRVGAPAVAFADGSNVRRRITRLVGGAPPEPHCPLWAAGLLVALVACTATALPIIAPGTAPIEPSSATPMAPVTATTRDSALPIPRPAESPSEASAPTPLEAPPAELAAAALPAAAPRPDAPAPPPPAAEASPVPTGHPTEPPAAKAPEPPPEAVVDAARAQARQHARESREAAELAARAAAHAARRIEVRELAHQRLEERARELRAEAECAARARRLAADERARATEHAAAEQRRAALRQARELSAQERERLRTEADQLRAAATEGGREAAARFREEARAAADEAHRLAEEAKSERRPTPGPQ